MRAWAWWFAVAGAVAGARELDPGACGARFDVQRDKIIRTEESREMGARYLSELDVGARHECLRLCCETDACDVFVYEEKSPGSCYLFNCGPPEDFRCKFTAHSNFSSGVLALSRRLAELQDQERLAHHERELANLRSATSSTSSPAAAASARPPPPQPPQPPQPPSPSTHLTPRRCSRYEFACAHGGECVAVYNACDGVPQCADGSDEAPELGCPAPPAPPAPPTPPTPPAVTPAPKPAQIPENAESGVGSDNSIVEGGAGGGGWPHRLTQAQPHRTYPDAGHGSHIFSHKGGLLQETEPGGPLAAQYPPFEPPWQRRPWPQPQPDVEWGGGAAYEREWPAPAAPRREWPAGPAAPASPRRAWPVPPRPAPEMGVYVPPKTMAEMPMVYGSQQQTLRDSPKKGLHLEKETERPAPEPPAPAPPTTPPTPAPAANQQPQPQRAAAAVVAAAATQRARAPERHLAGDEHDGLSERPPAAILLLVLGVGMTGGLGALAACRARAARRRLRRGKSPFAHDADYLVNGMYL